VLVVAVRNGRHAVVAVAGILLWLVAVAPAAQRPVLSDAAVQELDSVIRAAQAEAKIPGLSVAVAFRDQPVYSKAFGMADLEHRISATPATAFRTASIAKPLTATAVMQLVEQGRIDLDAPIQRYCAAFPEKPWPVTARQLLSHQAGIRHYQKPGESTGTQHYFTIQDSLALFKNDPLLHEPGTKYLYSTYGYSVLGCAIEGASGQVYETYMRDHVFAPAGMTRTRLDRIYEIVPDRSRGYQLLTAEVLKQLPPQVQSFARAGEIYHASLHDTSMKVPGGGLVSTAEDLMRFGVVTNTHGLLKRDTVELMWTEVKTRPGEATGYGLGWGVTPAQDGIRRLTHSGNQAGAASVLHVLPEVGLSYAIMTNLEDAVLGPMSRGIAQTLGKHLMR